MKKINFFILKYTTILIIFKKIKNYLFLHGHIILIICLYIWQIIFLFFPFLLILKISFSKIVYSIPPYSNLIFWHDKQFSIILNFKNYIQLIQDSLYLYSFLQSLKIAIISTIICFLIGYPIAWIISQMKYSNRNIFLMLIILPSWTPLLIRIYEVMNILNFNGILNYFFIKFGIIKNPIEILYTDFAMYIGIVYCYLPFMILPIYTEFRRIDYSLIEASLNLGAGPTKTFLKIVLPLTKKGIISGCIFVFIPSLGEYIIPELLGGTKNVMLGRIIWEEFFNNHDWPVASALSISFLLFLMFPIFLLYKYQNKEEKNENYKT